MLPIIYSWNYVPKSLLLHTLTWESLDWKTVHTKPCLTLSSFPYPYSLAYSILNIISRLNPLALLSWLQTVNVAVYRTNASITTYIWMNSLYSSSYHRRHHILIPLSSLPSHHHYCVAATQALWYKIEVAAI